MTWLLVTRRPFGPALAHLGLIPRHPYSAVPFPSNWELWRNLPDATQHMAYQLVEGKNTGAPAGEPNGADRNLPAEGRFFGNLLHHCRLGVHSILRTPGLCGLLGS